jgi:hypothetical protein
MEEHWLTPLREIIAVNKMTCPNQGQSARSLPNPLATGLANRPNLHLSLLYLLCPESPLRLNAKNSQKAPGLLLHMKIKYIFLILDSPALSIEHICDRKLCL